MGTISLTNPVAGTTIAAGLHATNYTTIQTVVNGGLDNNNINTSAAIQVSKLAAGTNGFVLATVGGVPTWQAAAGTPGYATTLPGSPSDGQEAVLVDSITLPTYQWRFRWNAGSSNADKWECIGGAPALVEVATAETTASTTYAALATAGPSFPAPRPGVYNVEIGFDGDISTTGTISMSYDVGPSSAVDADRIRALLTGSGSGSPAAFYSLARARLKSGLGIWTLTAKYKTSTGTGTFENRWMRVMPIRVS